MNRNGGRNAYRATAAEKRAGEQRSRPKTPMPAHDAYTAAASR